MLKVKFKTTERSVDLDKVKKRPSIVSVMSFPKVLKRENVYFQEIIFLKL